MDAMGAEYLGYLQSKCFDNGLEFSANIARCNLPSITSMNKEFVDEFQDVECKVYSNKNMDELKHDGTFTYDYEGNKYPIHLVEEIDILNKLVTQLKAMPKEETAYVIADHGATRLAVINEKENKWEVSEKEYTQEGVVRKQTFLRSRNMQQKKMISGVLLTMIDSKVGERRW